jgi:predicted DNA helicase
VIRQSVLQGQKVLACAPSNTAVDHLLEELVGYGLEAVRIGHPARVAPILQQHTLDALAQEDPANEIVHQLMRDAERAMRKAERWTRSRPMPGQKHQHRAEARQLREDAKLLQRQIIESILDRAEVICATTTFDPEVLGDRWFDLAVIDEACQSTEPGSWPCVLRAERMVLAGDHCQLPPTVLSKPAAQEGFSISLMERLVRDVCPEASRRLTIQYRMHESIMSFSSKEFYDGTLTADPSVASHTLNDLAGITPLAWTENPLRWIDTAGAGWEEEQEPDGESRMNRKEADLVAWLARQWVEAGNAPDALAVIAPYAAQVRLLRQRLSSQGIEVDTVDGFQGREKEAILISMVRSNNSGEIGFLSDTRRMNVAITRARRLLVLIGDSATVTGDPFFGRLLEHVEQQGVYQSVWEYPEVM